MTQGLLVIKKDIVGQSLHRVSMSTSNPIKKKLTFMLMMLLSLVLGMTMFWSGIHNTDLSQHYYKDNTWRESLESNGFGMVSTIDDMYMQGLDLIIAGFFVFAYGFFIFGILVRDVVKTL